MVTPLKYLSQSDPEMAYGLVAVVVTERGVYSHTNGKYAQMMGAVIVYSSMCICYVYMYIIVYFIYIYIIIYVCIIIYEYTHINTDIDTEK